MKSKFIIPFFMTIFLITCGKSDEAGVQSEAVESDSPFAELMDEEIRRLSNYDFEPSSSVISRVVEVPGSIIRYLSEMDGRDYTAYLPNSDELKIIEDAIESLSPIHKKTIKERVIGIYFINDFWGSGIADFVVEDKNGDVYVFLVFNAQTLKAGISEWVTYKENTCFINNANDLKVVIDVGAELNAFYYILAHESSHALDYINHITPYVEEATLTVRRHFQQQVPQTTPFVKDVWQDYDLPFEDSDYSLRDKVTFYGFGGGPLIGINGAVGVYRQLEQTPFVSLYASKIWAEDFAEFYAFYYLTQKMDQPYVINVLEADDSADVAGEVSEVGVNGAEKIIFQYEPMKNPLVTNRFAIMESLYNEN